MTYTFWRTISRPQITKVVMAGVMRDEELDLLHNAELKEAFDEFDKVEIVEYFDYYTYVDVT